MDRIYQAELDHDSGFSEKQLEPFRQEALDLLIDRLFEGNSVGGIFLDAYVESHAGSVAASLRTCTSVWGVRNALEDLIRRDLEDSETLTETMVELAGGE